MTMSRQSNCIIIKAQYINSTFGSVVIIRELQCFDSTRHKQIYLCHAWASVSTCHDLIFYKPYFFIHGKFEYILYGQLHWLLHFSGMILFSLLLIMWLRFFIMMAFGVVIRWFGVKWLCIHRERKSKTKDHFHITEHFHFAFISLYFERKQKEIKYEIEMQNMRIYFILTRMYHSKH